VVSSSFTVTYGASKFAGSVITGREKMREGGKEGGVEGGAEGERERRGVHSRPTISSFSLFEIFLFNSDHVSCRALFSLGLVLTGVLCLIFSLSSELPRLCLLWSLHGVVQVGGGGESGEKEQEGEHKGVSRSLPNSDMT